MSTLCAGCGHDSVTAALIQAFWELDLPPHRAAKMSGIGCSSKTTAYFMKQSHGFNSVHGRMPSVATGANAANRDLTYIGISGDGDSLSIGLGQLCHAIRRNVHMLYVLENNGVYGLTKGQFSASADIGSKSKKGEANVQPPIDPVLLALTLGRDVRGRGLLGRQGAARADLKAGLTHNGFALIDVISPCVTFNDHEGSTKSYKYTREHELRDGAGRLRAAAPRDQARTGHGRRDHDGDDARRQRRAVPADPRRHTTRPTARRPTRTCAQCQRRGEVATGLLFIDEHGSDMHDAERRR